MAKDSFSLNKLPGKTVFSGRRRTATRRAGFKSHPDSTGGQFKIEKVRTWQVKAGEQLLLTFHVPATDAEHFAGFGVWYLAPKSVQVEVHGSPPAVEVSLPDAPNWSKVGSMWRDSNARTVTVSFARGDDFEIAVYGAAAGHIRHRHLAGAKAVLLKNMHRYSPEANFYEGELPAEAAIAGAAATGRDTGHEALLYLKTCNRCARYLPINVQDERHTLSFSNHCVAAHRRPCRHGGFGVLRNEETGQVAVLDYGFQLECRFCKKFEVNAAHNPQRTSAQMKEDAQRRRAFELLLTELMHGSPQLLYRHETGRELADDIWSRFGKQCFNCGTGLPKQRGMCLDHTRPLALLWPLDGTATALCGQCNSAKRDRYPTDFYKDAEKLEALAGLTGIPLDELQNPQPNVDMIRRLRGRLDWFFAEFLAKPENTKERDGKIVGELIVKALQKAINAAPATERFDLVGEYERERAA